MKKDPLNLGLILVFAVSVAVISGQGFAFPVLENAGTVLFSLTAAACLQLAFCRSGWKIPVRMIPMAIGALAVLWGLWSFLTGGDPDGRGWTLLRDCAVPFAGAAAAWFGYAFFLRKMHKKRAA